MDLPLRTLGRGAAALFGTFLALFLATAGPDYLALLEGEVQHDDPVLTRDIVAYDYNEDGTVAYEYKAEPLPPLLDPQEDPTLRTESSYTKYLGINEEGLPEYELIAYTDEAYVEEEGQWFAREHGTTDRATFAAARRSDPIASLFWERAVAVDYYAGAGDGDIFHSNAVFSTARDAADGTTVSSSATTFVVKTRNNGGTLEYEIQRGFLPFDTSSIPSGATVSAASLTLYPTAVTNGDNDGTDYITVLRSSQATHTTLATADYDQAGSTEGISSASRKDITTIVAATPFTFSFTTGVSWVAKSGEASVCTATTGITCIGLREGHDFANSTIAPSQNSSVTFSSSEQTGTSQDPYLSVTYTGGATNSTLSKPPNNLGLIGFWNFNEGTSTQATDFSGRGNHGTLENFSSPQTQTSGWVAGKLRTALSFAGLASDDSVNVGDINATDGASTLTISAWIYDRNPAAGRGIVSKYAGASQSWALLVSDTGDGGLDDIAFTADGGTMTHTTGNVHQANRWEHWTVVYDGGSGISTLYLNGVAQTATDNGVVPPTTNSTTNVIRIGADSDLSAEFEGVIDEVRIYNRALGATEVASLYGSGAIRVLGSSAALTNGSTLGTSGGLVAHYTFDGDTVRWTSATAPTIIDATGGGRNGTGFSMNQATSTQIGKLGQALLFDGVADYIQVPDNNTLDLGDVMSFSLWVKRTSAPNANCVETLFGKGNLGGYGLDILNPGCGTSGRLQLCFNSLGCVMESTVSILDNEWHHVVATKNGTSRVFYVDGVAGTSLLTNQTGANTTQDLYIGIDSNFGPSAGSEFKGQIDDFRIYNRELTAAEALQLYRLGAAVIRP